VFSIKKGDSPIYRSRHQAAKVILADTRTYRRLSTF